MFLKATVAAWLLSSCAFALSAGESLSNLTARAQAGDVHAQAIVGVIHSRGELRTHVDYPTALKWLKPAADKGDSLAIYEMGVMHDQGYGVTMNKARARELISKAGPGLKAHADQGDLRSMASIAYCLSQGLGVKTDPKLQKIACNRQRGGWADGRRTAAGKGGGIALGWVRVRG